MLDDVIKHDYEWRRLLTKANELRHERRKITNEIAAFKKAGKEIKKQIEKGRKLDAEIVALEQQVEKHRRSTSPYGTACS